MHTRSMSDVILSVDRLLQKRRETSREGSDVKLRSSRVKIDTAAGNNTIWTSRCRKEEAIFDPRAKHMQASPSGVKPAVSGHPQTCHRILFKATPGAIKVIYDRLKWNRLSLGDSLLGSHNEAVSSPGPSTEGDCRPHKRTAAPRIDK